MALCTKVSYYIEYRKRDPNLENYPICMGSALNHGTSGRSYGCEEDDDYYEVKTDNDILST